MFKILFLIFLMIFASCIPELEMKQKKEIVEDTVEEEMFFHEMPEIFDVEDAPDLPDLQDIVEIIDVVDAKDTADIIDVKETADITDIKDIADIKDATDVSDAKDIADVFDIADAADIKDLPEVCAPFCENKECGNNGCGGNCGSCDFPFVCGVYKCVCYSTPCDVSGKLPDTGQEKCYNDTAEVTCGDASAQGFHGQDGHYKTNQMSFTDNGDGTVTDNVTGLVWMKCSIGQSGSDCSSGSAVPMTWQAAVDECKKPFAGFSDWRLPTRWEFQTIVNYGKWVPAIDVNYFPNTISAWYWSSSSYASGTYYAWVVDFGNGYVDGYYKDDYGYVRCVRSGQLKIWLFNDNGNGTVSDSGTGLMWQKATAPGTYKWKDALKYCEDLTLAGYSDWRLPDIKELSSIVDDSKYGPAIDSIYFPDTKSDWYWSSSSDASDTSFAWGVGFSYGYVDDGYKGNDNYVRCVRSGQ